MVSLPAAAAAAKCCCLFVSHGYTLFLPLPLSTLPLAGCLHCVCATLHLWPTTISVFRFVCTIYAQQSKEYERGRERERVRGDGEKSTRPLAVHSVRWLAKKLCIFFEFLSQKACVLVSVSVSLSVSVRILATVATTKTMSMYPYVYTHTYLYTYAHSHTHSHSQLHLQ